MSVEQLTVNTNAINNTDNFNITTGLPKKITGPLFMDFKFENYKGCVYLRTALFAWFLVDFFNLSIFSVNQV